MKPPKFTNVRNGRADVVFDGKIVGFVSRNRNRWEAWYINREGDYIAIKEHCVFPTQYRSRWRAVQAIEMKLRGGYTYRKGSFTTWVPLSQSKYIFDDLGRL